MLMSRSRCSFLTRSVPAGLAAWGALAGLAIGVAALAGVGPEASKGSSPGGNSPACDPSSGPKGKDADSSMPLTLPSVTDTEPKNYPGLHQVVAYAEGLYSGSAPDDAEGYRTLKALGIRTIISVDGAIPDVATAKSLGMRYVHLPIGYNGMDHQRTLEIARAVRDLPGPTYIHCHHGKHRSAGATAAAAVTLGKGTKEAMLDRMKVSGTAANYTGLFKCVQVATIASQAELDKASNQFPETWKTHGLIKSMVEMDEVFDHLKLIEKAGWFAPSDHPDLVPVAEAGRIRDLLRNLLDDDRVKAKPAEFRDWLRADSETASKIEDALAKVDASKGEKPDTRKLSEKFGELAASCKACHTKYRD